MTALINPYIYGVPEIPSYANPGGTGNRTGLIAVTFNWTPSAGKGQADNLVDGSFGSNLTDAFQFNTGGQRGAIISFDFGAAVYKEITEWKWYQSGSSAHGTWRLFGSNDAVQLVLLLEDLALGGATLGTFTPTAFGGYRYYYLLEKDGGVSGANSVMWNQEIEFKIRNTPQAASTPGTPSYDNAGGRGPRASLITVTTDFPTANGSVDLIVDGFFDNSSTYGWTPSTSQNTKYVQFDFGTAKILTEMTLKIRLSINMGEWKVQGSPDASVWTDIGAAFTLNGTDFTINSISGNVTAYRYYRLFKTATNNTSATQSLWHEIEFKIAT